MTLVCPACRGALAPAERAYSCSTCGREYAATLGIPDLRHTREHEDDAALVARLTAAFPRATFDELVELRLSTAGDLPADLREAYAVYRRERLVRGRRLYAMFRAGVRARYGEPGRGVALDLGCGVGASLLAMAGDFVQVVGIDPSLPDLLLARKALEQAGVTNVTLAQAYAQGVPLADECCAWASAQNVLEHVMDLDGALREVGRVLGRGGAFAADSRNRYDLFFVEPHVRLRWVGFVPRRWQAAYVRARRGLAYSGTRLLSYGELLGALRRHIGPRAAVAYPDVTAYGAGAAFARAVALAGRAPLLGGLLLRVFPTHLAVGLRGN